MAAQYGQTAFLYHVALRWDADVDQPDVDGEPAGDASPDCWTPNVHIKQQCWPKACIQLVLGVEKL